MRLITPEIEIDESDPFKNDKLNRKPFAKSLTNLINNIEDPLVIAFDGKWGDGKTTFVKMWQQHLNQQGFCTIYFDAFASDYLDDAFIALLGNISIAIEAAYPKSSRVRTKLNQVKKAAIEAAPSLLSWMSSISLKALTMGIIGAEEVKQLQDIKEKITAAPKDYASIMLKEKLTLFSEENKSIEEFRAKLADLAREIFEEKKKSLVFIIDELDRCRPNFAVQLLEKVKHLLSVNHINFVLVMNIEQLEQTIRCIYGQNIDARTYLQKFIHLRCSLPKNTETRHDNEYARYCNALAKSYGLQPEHDYPLDIMEFFARAYKFSLRDIERYFTYLVLFYAASSKSSYRDSCAIPFLGVLKIKRPELFDILKSGTASFNSLWRELNFDKVEPNLHDELHRNMLKTVLRMYLLPDEEFEKLSDTDDERTYWNGITAQYHFRARNQALTYLCEKMDSFEFQEGN